MNSKLVKVELPFEIKEGTVTDEGTFEGLASVYGIVDLGGEVVEKGAFARTIKARPKVTILWRHDQPIGIGELEDGEKGLTIRGKLTLKVQQAAEALALMKDGAVRGLSIGFTTVKDEVKDGIRHLREVKLWEVSLTPFPMNLAAMVTNVKERVDGKKDFVEELDKIETGSGHFTMMWALDCALSDCEEGEDPEAMAAEAGMCIDQFKTAYLEWFPRHAAMMAANPMEMYGKEGRALSAANRAKIEAVMADHRAAMEKLQALLDESTSSPKEELAPEPAAPAADPEKHHSAIVTQIKSLREVFQWN